MKRLVLTGAAVAVLSLATAPAGADEGTLPGGTPISVEIDAPTDGQLVTVDESVAVSGTASVAAGEGSPDLTVVYVVDVSTSTGGGSGANCDGVAGNDSVLACELALVKSVNAGAALAGSPVVSSGVVLFNNRGTIRDMDKAQPGVQSLAPPGPGVEKSLKAITADGGTRYGSGLATANTVLSGPGVTDAKVVVFVTDGGGDGTAPLPPGTIVRTYQIGGTACGANLVSFSTTCEVVDLAALPTVDDVLAGTSVTTHLTELAVSVDGGTPVVIGPDGVDPDLPQDGPATVSFTTSVGPLPSGTHEICVTATGDDGGGVGSVDDCVTVESMLAVVDCSAPGSCAASVVGQDQTQASFQAEQAFEKTVGMRWVDPQTETCGTAACTTAYDVLFQADGTGAASLSTTHPPPHHTGPVAQLTVLMPKGLSTPPADAAVYVDDVRVTAQCRLILRYSPIPCVRITRTFTGQTRYFVLFDADPRFTFR